MENKNKNNSEETFQYSLSSKKKKIGFFKKTSITLFFLAAFFGGIFLGIILYSIDSEEQMKELAAFRPSLPTRLYDRHGKLITELFQTRRELVKLSQIPAGVQAAFLAIEDTRFYSHFGIDFQGIARAMYENIKAGRIVQGGSTITQQLVKGLFTKGERSISRKIYEMFLAFQIEKRYTKEEILEMYFNQIYLGHGTYGIATASRFYFDKPVEELNIVEATVLARLPKGPTIFSPLSNPHRARKENRTSMNILVRENYLTQKEADTLYKNFWREYWKHLVVSPPSKTTFSGKQSPAPHFTEYIRHLLIKRYGKEQVYSMGFQVYTTLDLDQQLIAEKHLQEAIHRQDKIARAENSVYEEKLNRNLLNIYFKLGKILPVSGLQYSYSLRSDFKEQARRRIGDTLALTSLLLPVASVQKASLDLIEQGQSKTADINVEGAFLAMEPSTGQITAMIGGREFTSSNQFNRALQARRQPGSAFKPFIYGAAIENRKVHYASGFLDAPLLNVSEEGEIWEPSNYGGEFRGYVLLYKALASSLNLISVQLYDLVGPDAIQEFASKLMKIPRKRFNLNPSLALGTSEVTPYELLQGISIIANDGNNVIPHAILYVADHDGNILYDAESEVLRELSQKKKRRLVERDVVYILRRMMQGVVDGGTASNAVRGIGNFHGAAAGKTGTTSSWKDAWFVGFNPEVAAVVWMGIDKGSMSLGRHQAGGKVCAPVWGKFMHDYYEKIDRKPPYFNGMPASVVVKNVCADTGGWINPECPNKPTLASYFPSPLVKTDKDGNVITRSVPNKMCPCELVQSKSFEDLLKEQEQKQETENDAQTAEVTEDVLPSNEAQVASQSRLKNKKKKVETNH